MLSLQSHLGLGHREGPSPEGLMAVPLLEEIMVLFLQVGLWECDARQMAAFLGLWRHEVRMRTKGSRPQAAAGSVRGQTGICSAWSCHVQPPLPSHPLTISLSDCSQGPAPSLCHHGCSMSGEFIFQDLSAVFLPQKS